MWLCVGRLVRDKISRRARLGGAKGSHLAARGLLNHVTFVSPTARAGVTPSAESVSGPGAGLLPPCHVGWRPTGGCRSRLGQVGEALGRATLAYTKAIGSLESRVLVQARRFKDLGAAVGEDIPEMETVSLAPRQLAIPGLEPDSEPEDEER